MRRYMTALLIFSVFHLAFAAPVNIGETLEVRSNAVDAPKGGIAAWEKRMDNNVPKEGEDIPKEGDDVPKEGDDRENNPEGDPGPSGDNSAESSDARGPDPEPENENPDDRARPPDNADGSGNDMYRGEPWPPIEPGPSTILDVVRPDGSRLHISEDDSAEEIYALLKSLRPRSGMGTALQGTGNIEAPVRGLRGLRARATPASSSEAEVRL